MNVDDDVDDDDLCYPTRRGSFILCNYDLKLGDPFSIVPLK